MNETSHTVDHPDLGSLRAAIVRHAACFAAPAEPRRIEDEAHWAGRLRMHRSGAAACLAIDGLAPQDLPRLRDLTPFAFLPGPEEAAGSFFPAGVAQSLLDHRFKLFHGHRALRRPGPSNGSGIGTLEFLMSSADRLRAYPAGGAGRVLHDGGRAAHPGAVRAVFVLDLIQDFEILQPMLVRTAEPFGPFQPVAAITERVLGSQIWDEVRAFLEAIGMPWFKPIGPADVTAALGRRRSVLLTASETNAPGHVFCHQACRAAPPQAVRVTFQHGHECIGLRHHRAHDMQFPQGVRFASDFIFTWRPVDELFNLHPADRGRCLAVGVTKRSAERAAALLEAEGSGQPLPEPREIASRGAVIVAENLHSVRFASPQRYQRFLRFIEESHARDGLRIVVRSHPGKRTLELTRDRHPFAFLGGSLTADHFHASRGLVSPPSTVLLDAAMTVRPAAVWTDSRMLGDAENYAGLPAVTHAEELDDAVLAHPEACGLSAHRWAVDNSVALNGLPAAWNRLCELVDR